MSGPDFFQTGMGRKYYEVHVPAMIKAMNRIADSLEKLAEEQTSNRSTTPLAQAFQGLAKLPTPSLNITIPDNQKGNGHV